MPKRDRTAYYRAYYLAHREKEIARTRLWLKNNPEKRAKISRRYHKKHRTKLRKTRREYVANRRKNDPIFRLQLNVRRRVNHAIEWLRAKKDRRTLDILGCDIDTLRRHLESKFKPGMTWENYGEWHVDHIIPLAQGRTKAKLEKLCHYTNLAPLWAEDNLKKGAKLKWPSRRIKASHRPHTELR